MKHILTIICITVTLCSLIGCQFTDYASYDMEWGLDNTKVEIYNGFEEKIGDIEIGSTKILLEDRIVYSKRPSGIAKFSNTFDYYCYDLKTNENEYLGTIKNEYGSLAYQELYYNDHVYILRTIGDPIKDVKEEYAVFDINIIEKTINKIHSTKEGHIYDTLSIVNGKLLITHLNESGFCSVVEHNIETGEEKTVLTSDCQTGNVIRITCSDNEHVYVLRVLYGENHTDNILFLDTYDLDYELISSLDLKDIFDTEEQLNFDQTDQVIVNFLFSNGYMLYDNRSTDRFLGQITENGSVKSIIKDSSGLIDSAHNVYKDDKYFMFVKLGYNEDTDKLVLFDTSDSSLKVCELNISEENYYLCSVLKTSDDHIALDMSLNNVSDVQDLPDKIYYMPMSDLEFKDVTYTDD